MNDETERRNKCWKDKKWWNKEEKGDSDQE